MIIDRPTVPNIYGTDFSDNESFDPFPVWRSKIKGNDNPNDIFAKKGNDLAYGYGGDDNIDGASGTDSLYGGTGNDSMDGGDGNDRLYGEWGNDTLVGGVGINDLFGGTGNDRYILAASSTNTVVEDANAGTDLVVSPLTSYTLPANVENLNLGTGAVNGYGNSLPNTINGNTSANILSGGDGNDTVSGESGNDTVFGGSGNDQLKGNSGIDNLNGGLGADNMDGGDQNDIYIVDNGLDIAAEVNSDSLVGGIDIVEASVTYTLSSNLENLTLTGVGAINGTGNARNNVIKGNSANNVLSGLGGNDQLSGGSGNDQLSGGSGSDRLDGGTGVDSLDGGDGNDYYIVDNLSDIATEVWGDAVGGVDTVDTSVTYTLSNNLENLLLTGLAANGTGNSRNNEIRGNNGNNVLSGLDGNDTVYGKGGNDTVTGGGGNDRIFSDSGNDSLTGGTGSDTFGYFAIRSFVNTDFGIDTITDFARGIDKICLDKTPFPALSSNVGMGLSNASDFATVTTDAAAAISNAPIVYNSTNGKLFYNPNRSTSGFASSSSSGGHFITLAGNPVISSSDFGVEQQFILL